MKNMTCIVCPNGCRMSVSVETNPIEVSGNLCPKGKDFAVNELTAPTRSIASTVKTIFKEMPRLPVRTDGEIPKSMIFNVMNRINSVNLDKKIKIGDIILENVCNTGINIIATSNLE